MIFSNKQKTSINHGSQYNHIDFEASSPTNSPLFTLNSQMAILVVKLFKYLVIAEHTGTWYSGSLHTHIFMEFTTKFIILKWSGVSRDDAPGLPNLLALFQFLR